VVIDADQVLRHRPSLTRQPGRRTGPRAAEATVRPTVRLKTFGLCRKCSVKFGFQIAR